MKKLALSLFGAITLLLTGGSAFAQHVHVRADIPFEFTINNKTMPAGTYELLNAGMPSNPRVLLIRQLDGSQAIYINASDLESSAVSNQSKLVFHFYGTQYFLAQIWTEGTRAGWEFPKPRAETREARNNAVEQITLSAKLSK